MNQETHGQAPGPHAGSRHRQTSTTAAKPTAAFLWGIAIALIMIAALTCRDPAVRLHVLRVILILAAAGEGLGAVSGIFQPQRFAEQNGRPYDPAYHGVSQDFGFYNLGFALLLVLSSVAPTRHSGVIATAIAIYAIHGMTHVFRYFGLYYGGGAEIPTRPQVFEMRDGLQLIAGALGMALFFP